MPGTIQVSILELVGLPTLLQSSSMGIKVSVGKQAHETQGKGDFSFPLASLRDNLNVSIHDSDGNEIAHTVVETRSIVEKGNWDDMFALQGGGHVHMRLHFNLSEHEQNRIRSMRESATRKKQEDLPKRSHSSSDLAVASGGGSVSPASSQDSLKTAHQAEERHVNLAGAQTNKTSASSLAKAPTKAHPGQKKQALPTSKSAAALDKLPVDRHVKEVIQPQHENQQSLLGKNPSNVRKMVLAFESSPVKEAVPASNKPRAVPQLSSSATVDVSSKEPSIKKTAAVNVKPTTTATTTTTTHCIPSGVGSADVQMYSVLPLTKDVSEARNVKPVLSNLETPSTPPIADVIQKGTDKKDSCDPVQENLVQKTEQSKEIRDQTIDQRSSKNKVSEKEPDGEENKEEKNFPKKLHRSSIFERSEFHWNTLAQAFSNRKRPGTELFTEQNWRSNHWKSSQHRVKSKKCHRNEHSSNNFRGWIFLDETVRSCIHNDDILFLDLLEGCLCSTETSQGKLADAEVVTSQDSNSSAQTQKLGSFSQPNKGAPRRPTGQAIKIAVMIGFGVLVFFTRQRK